MKERQIIPNSAEKKNILNKEGTSFGEPSAPLVITSLTQPSHHYHHNLPQNKDENGGKTSIVVALVRKFREVACSEREARIKIKSSLPPSNLASRPRGRSKGSRVGGMNGVAGVAPVLALVGKGCGLA